MDETAAVEGMQLNGAEERDRRSRKRVLIVAKGFDVSVPEWCTLRKHVLCLESMLRDHFSSCGKIKSVCIPHPYHSSTIKRFAYIEILGEGAKEKALQLSGAKMMDGHKLVVTAPLLPLKRARRRALKTYRSCRSETMTVKGYDTSVPRKIIKSALGKHFSSCGEVLEVDLYPNKKSPNSTRKFAYVSIYGEGAEEKALQLNGSDMGGFKLVVEKAFCPKPPEAGGRPPSPDYVWALPYSEYMAALRNKRMENPDTNKSKEDPNTNKRKENPNPNRNEKKKKQKTSK